MIFATGNFLQLCCWNNSTNELFFTCSFQSELFFFSLAQNVKSFLSCSDVEKFSATRFQKFVPSAVISISSSAHKVRLNGFSVLSFTLRCNLTELDHGYAADEPCFRSTDADPTTPSFRQWKTPDTSRLWFRKFIHRKAFDERFIEVILYP